LLRSGESGADSSKTVRQRVEKTWALQIKRSGVNNARLSGEDLDSVCEATDECWALLENAAERFNLSARAHQRVLRVARTIADLAGDKKITPPHVAEALSLRCLDRQS
jgi:magnesium chelatase family protein